jgi:hypothetical protein
VVAFTGLFNSSESPLHDLVERLDGRDGIGQARVFRHQDVDEANEFIMLS